MTFSAQLAPWLSAATPRGPWTSTRQSVDRGLDTPRISLRHKRGVAAWSSGQDGAVVPVTCLVASVVCLSTLAKGQGHRGGFIHPGPVPLVVAVRRGGLRLHGLAALLGLGSFLSWPLPLWSPTSKCLPHRQRRSPVRGLSLHPGGIYETRGLHRDVTISPCLPVRSFTFKRSKSSGVPCGSCGADAKAAYVQTRLAHGASRTHAIDTAPAVLIEAALASFVASRHRPIVM
jgi:hypothetical protein